MRLTRNRWYNSEGQRELSRSAASQTKGTRTVISLVVLLVLVILCMQQLQDPKKYKPAFQAIGLTKAANPDDSSNNKDESPTSVDQVQFVQPSDENITQLAQVWLNLLGQSNSDVLRSTATACFAFDDLRNELDSAPTIVTTDLKSFLDQSQMQLDQWATDAASQAADSNAALTTFSQAWDDYRKDNDDLLPKPATPLRASLELAIDRLLLDSFEDASFWQAKENFPFARALQLASQARNATLEAQPNAVSTLHAMSPQVDLPLLTKEMADLRGKIVKVRGYIARAEPEIISKSSNLGTQYYQIIWLRPEQSFSTPICMYMPCAKDAPLSFQVSNEQRMEFVGLPIKRLAYRAVQSIEVAPVLFGISFKPVIDQSPKNTSDTNTDLQTQESRSLMTSLQSLSPNFFLNRNSLFWTSPSQQAAVRQAIDLLVTKPLGELQVKGSSALNLAMEASSIDDATIQNIVQVLKGLERCKHSFQDELLSQGFVLGPDAKMNRAKMIVRSIDRFALAKTLQETVGLKEIYRLGMLDPMNMDDANASKSYAFVLQVPQAWKDESNINQPIELHGANWSDSENSLIPFWFANRIIWKIPSDWTEDQIRKLQPALDAEFVPLAMAGFDLSGVDIAKSLQKSRMMPNEQSAFLSLIAATNSEPASQTTPSAKIVDCLQRPDQLLARRVSGQAQSIRVTRITVDSRTDRELLGSNHYYEIDTLCDVGKQSIRLVPKEGGEPIVFEGKFPTTLVVRELPPTLQPQPPEHQTRDTSESWQVNLPIEFSGRFYRLWSYRSDQTQQQSDPTFRQIAPLVAVASIRLIPTQPDTASENIVSITFGFVMLLLITAWVLSRVLIKRRNTKKPLDQVKSKPLIIPKSDSE